MDKSFRLRLALSFLMIATLCAAVVFRSGVLMLVPSKQLSDALAKQFRQAPKPQPRRGLILDRNREPLAVSLDVRSLYADPGKVRNRKSLSRKLARMLNISAEKLEARLAQDKGFVWVKRYLNKAEELRVRTFLDENRQLNLVLGFAKESKRFYPNMHLAAHVIGFTGVDGQGLEGLEYFYDRQLSGLESSSDAIDGKNLVLTLEKGLQHTVENELQQGVEKAGGKSGTAIVMDADTGDIWAMASWPTYNLNEFQAAQPDARRNRIVTEPFEPGSTLKTILVGGALEAGLVKPESKFFCENGKMQIGDRWIKESSQDRDWTWLTVNEVIKYSSNIGATKIGMKYGKENLFKLLLKQGLATKSNIDLPGEASGVLTRPSAWSEIQFSNISFGQGMTATPIQLIRAFAAIANGGFLVQPRIVSMLEDVNNQSVERLPVRMERTWKPSTTRTLTRMMVGVTDAEGTGIKAKIAGFEIAGKTGTSQVAQAGVGYASGKYVASFIGFPVGVKPSLIGFVAVSEPKFPNVFGGEVAAPIFQKIMSVALARAGVHPEGPDMEQEITITQSSIARTPPAPSADPVVDQALAKLGELQAKELGEYVMPALVGRSARQVLDAFSEKPVQLQIEGTGMVVEQWPPAGQPYHKGQVVRFRLDPPDSVIR